MRKPWHALIPVVGLLLLAIASVYWSAVQSADPMRDYVGHRHPETYEYPTAGVIEWSAAILAEALLTSWIVWRAKSLAMTCFAAGFMYVCCFFGMLVLAMHAPVYFTSHILWLLVGGVWLGLAALITGVLRATSSRGDSA
jgi:hypothetical protein